MNDRWCYGFADEPIGAMIHVGEVWIWVPVQSGWLLGRRSGGVVLSLHLHENFAPAVLIAFIA